MFPMNVTNAPLIGGPGNQSEGANEAPPTGMPDDARPWWWFYQYLPYRILVTFFLANIFPIVFSAFGMASNIINMIVFYRQGIWADSCTPCLLGLAVSDFCNCLLRFAKTPLQSVYNIVFVGYPNKGMPSPSLYNAHVVGYFIEKAAPLFTINTCWITVYIGIERMVSVTFPFHVKRFFTAKRSCIAITSIFLVSFLIQVPYLFNNKVIFLGEYMRGIRTNIFSRQFYLNAFYVDTYLRALSLCIIVVCNAVIVLKVKKSNKFRKSNVSASTNSSAPSSSSTDNKDSKKTQTKEDKLTVMMVSLSIFFVLCVLPHSIFVTMSIAHKIYGQYQNMPRYVFEMLDALRITTEAINSSCNIIFYYTMSGKFKKELLQLFSTCKRTKINS